MKKLDNDKFVICRYFASTNAMKHLFENKFIFKI